MRVYGTLIWCSTNIYPVGRTFITPHSFPRAKWSLGRWSRPLAFIALIWNIYLAAVLFSPIEFPVTASTFNCMYFLYLFFKTEF